MASEPRCLGCLMFMPSGPMKFLFLPFEMATCTCVVVSYISLVGRVLIVWSMCLVILFDVSEFLKCFCFVYVSDGCFTSKANASVLLCRWFYIG